VPENSNNKWTPEEDARLKSLIEANTSIGPAQILDRGQYVHSSHRSEVEEVGPSHKVPREHTEHIDETGTGRVEGEGQMSETLSLSIFTIEADKRVLGHDHNAVEGYMLQLCKRLRR
jgi:hypothetical protein